MMPSEDPALTKVALLTEGPVDKTHGTGNLLLRLLEDAPFSVSSIHLGLPGKTASFPSFHVAGAKTLAGIVNSLRRRISSLNGAICVSKKSIRSWRYLPSFKARRHLQEADLNLAVVYSAEGLRFVHDCLAAVGCSSPTVLWFMDLQFTTDDFRDPREDLPLLDSAHVWGFNSQITARLKELFPHKRNSIEQHMFLGVQIPKQRRGTVRELSPDTRCVMIGNFWDPTVVPVLEKIWGRACTLLQVDLPLHWHAPPEALVRLTQAGIKLGGGICYKGYVPKLEPVLIESDAAIMPFSIASSSASLFSRYSFPSRVADYAAHGLPVFAICGHDTPLAGYLKDSEAGIYEVGESVDKAASKLVEFLRTNQLREHCSLKARGYAEAHFELKQQRDLFASELLSAIAVNSAR